jgi:uncharacterized membrane protein
MAYYNLRTYIPTMGSLMLITSACVYVALRLRSISTPRMWGDEVFTYSAIQDSWIQLAKLVAGDLTHPPLSYVLLKVWGYLADGSISSLRVFTIAVSIASIIPLIALGRELRFQTCEIALALFLMSVSNYLILYSYVLRPYSLLLFFALCSLVAFVSFLRKNASGKCNVFMIVAVNILFVYVHYFAWLVVAAQYLWVALADRSALRRFTIATAIVVLGFLPWVGVIVYASTRVTLTLWDHFSVQGGVRLQSLVQLLRSFNGGFASTELTLMGSVCFLLVLISVPTYAILKRSRPKQVGYVCLEPLAFLAWITAFPIVVSLIVSATFTWIWEPRFLIIVIGPYLLLVAVSACRLRVPWTRALAVAFLAGWSMVAGLAPITGLTNDLADVQAGPNAPPYWLAIDLSRAETRTSGLVHVYGLDSNATAGLGLAFSITGEKRFEIIPSQTDASLLDDYFWIAFTEHDPRARARVTSLSANPEYALGTPIYSGVSGERYIAIPVRHNRFKTG